MAGVVRLSLVSSTGGIGEMVLGEVVFAQPEHEGMTAPSLAVQTLVAADSEGALLPLQTAREDLSEQIYLPLIVR